MIECPLHTAEIRRPCLVHVCDLWLDRTQYLNCGFVAYHTLPHDGEGLSLASLARLLGHSAVEIDNQVDEAFSLLRVIQLRDRANATPQWSLLRHTGKCLVCRRSATIIEDGWGWCSEECRVWAPIEIVRLEAKLGVRLAEVLRHARSSQISRIARLTGLNRKAVHTLLWQYMGIDQGTNTWERQEPLRPNPALPTQKDLRRRLSKAAAWKRTS